MRLRRFFHHKGYKGTQRKSEKSIHVEYSPTFVIFVYFVVKDLYKINRPSRLRRAIGYDFSTSSTSKASPNDTGIVIIIIIIIGEVKIVGFEHRGEIIAQSFLF